MTDFDCESYNKREICDIVRALWTNHLIFAQSKSFFRAYAAPIIVRTSFDFSISYEIEMLVENRT
jgi:hypothetical protein